MPERLYRGSKEALQSLNEGLPNPIYPSLLTSLDEGCRMTKAYTLTHMHARSAHNSCLPTARAMQR